MVVLILVIIGGAGGYAIYQNTRPKPVITLTSQYTDGATLVGAASTNFTVKGTDFTSSSAITFLLDGKSIPGASSAQSDSNGNVSSTTLSVTSAWPVGTHTLTAQDASSYVTKVGVKVEIVTPGQANTPGPNGAPTDSASGTVIETATVSGQAQPPETLIITGSPNGSTVCGSQDDGKAHSFSGVSSGLVYTGTLVLACSGTYKGGQLTYTQTATTYKFTFSNGVVCNATQPVVLEHLVGTFSSATAVSGSFSSDAYTISCNLGVPDQTIPAQQGSWTGLAVMH